VSLPFIPSTRHTNNRMLLPLQTGISAGLAAAAGLGLAAGGCAYAPRCSFAQNRCREAAPALRAFAGDRAVACHFPL